MAGIPREHSELYFDKLCRTQKAETVFSLIQATYHSKKSTSNAADVKTEIARRLQSAYDLFRDNIKGTSTGAGTYSGVPKQFESQYTIGHELCIWKNSNLDLIELAEKVATHVITIKDYFDIFFYNYFQPIDGKAIHPFYLIVRYMLDNNVLEVEKDKIPSILGVNANNENINALCNFLDGTNTIKYTGSSLKYVGNIPLSKIIKKCNIKYIGEEGLILARQELDTDEKYAKYITSELEIDDEVGNNVVLDDGVEFIDESTRCKGGKNIILYGVPGAGKSWTIKNEYCKNPEFMERLVFHPDYTYSDFVGQILPKIDAEGNVNYLFTPGPFTKLVKKAYKNPTKMFYLVIEEVNRGNAPAIVGDIFQLLDRNVNGGSEYEITNADIAKIVYGDENHKVTIPSNMCILCTMNTSDQNVFTLDTAFQRRWSMRLIKNKFDDSSASEKEFALTSILDTTVSWSKFFSEINKIILDKNIKMTSSEDKRLGTHFVNVEDLEFNSEIDSNGNMTLKARMQNSRFPEKVLKYLWDDAFKFTKEDVFDTSKFKSLEDVIEHFVFNKGNDRFKVFKDNIYNALVSNNNN